MFKVLRGHKPKYNRTASKQSEALNGYIQDLNIFLLCTEE